MPFPWIFPAGGALRQLTHELRLWEQVPKGGPIVWPILLILAVGLVVVAERILFLVRQRFDAGSLMITIDTLGADNKLARLSTGL